MEKFVKRIYNIQATLGVCLISIFFITVLIQVFCRYLGITVLWTGEVSSYSFIWAVFMGSGVMAYENKHFSFTLLLDKLEGKKKIHLQMLISTINLLFASAIFYYGIVITKKFWNYKWITLPKMSMGVTWLCVPILGLTMAIYCIYHIVQYKKELDKEESLVEKGGVK